MPVATFDTLKFANTLKAAGVPSQQAEAQAVAFAEVIQVNMKDLVTKEDLDRAVSDIRAGRQTSKSFKEALRADAAAFREEMRELVERQLAKIDAVEQRLIARIDNATTKLSGHMDLIGQRLNARAHLTKTGRMFRHICWMGYAAIIMLIILNIQVWSSPLSN